ncbi:uncharacterized protein [Parasteatoda tepidariorum]|uniref:uncharacterized protein n=1 Tax=Parasteatoda tepidariorum TaxID=114398 RepID=UPI0039BCB27D
MDPAILKVLSYEALSSYYPEPEWLRIYTNGSLLHDSPNAGAGVFSEAFSFYAPVRQGSAFDGQIDKIRIAIVQLQCYIDLFEKAVVLLVPAHCGAMGNENADYLAKKGALIIQTAAQIMSFCSIKQLIKRIFKTCDHEELIDRTSTKYWRPTILNFRNGSRRTAVAEFRLATGHDCLRKHLSRFGTVPSAVCTLCSSGEDMDSTHLLRCSAICRNSITERYWEARDML